MIGAGVAAATVAKTLLEGDPKHHLLVLEAGPRLLLKDRREWWDYVITGRAAYADCHDLSLPPRGSDEDAARFGETENASLGKDTWIFQESRVMGFDGSTTHWGSRLPRKDNLAVQYFARLLGEPGEGRRIIYAEGLGDERKALDLLGTHLVDTHIGAAFFNDPTRMHRDLLGDAAKEVLDGLFGKGGP